MSLKEQYIQSLRAQLDSWSSEIDRLEEKIRRIDPQLRISYEEQVAPMRRKQDEARRRLHELQTAPDDAWEELKCGTEIIWDRLRASLHNVRVHMISSHHTPRIVGKRHKHVYDPARFAGPSNPRQITRGTYHNAQIEGRGPHRRENSGSRQPSRPVR